MSVMPMLLVLLIIIINSSIVVVDVMIIGTPVIGIMMIMGVDADTSGSGQRPTARCGGTGRHHLECGRSQARAARAMRPRS
jgi:hypothetical protein